MVLLKRNSRHARDFLDRKRFLKQNKLQTTATTNYSEKLVPPWKISGMLLFLAVLVFLLIIHEEEELSADEILKSNQRYIPNPEKPLPPSSSKLFKFKLAAISSDSQTCSDLARQLMEKHNANGFDLALSALICNSMTNIQSMGLLGGFLMTAYTPSRNPKSIVIDAQMASPQKFQLPKNFADFSQLKEGPLSIATPGFLRGVWEIYKNFSSIPWHELIMPVESICREGVVLTKHLRDSIEMNERILRDEYFRSAFVDASTGRIKRAGTKIILAKQCDFLKILRLHNTSLDIFAGEIGQILSDDLKSANSTVTLDDLSAYTLKVYEVKKVELTDEHQLLVPNTCAILVPAILKVLLKYTFNANWSDVDVLQANTSVLMHHRIVEAFKHVFALRPRLGDPDFMDTGNITNYLLSDEFANHVLHSINDSSTRAHPREYNLSAIVPQDHGTSHISIMAQNGDAISVTSSINYYFGSGIVANRSGLVFNNGMDDFSFENRAVNYFGLTETPTNYPMPQKRALSSMAPVIVIDKRTQRPTLVIGAAGGSKIITSISIAILRFLRSSGNLSLKELIDAPRFHHQLIPDLVEYEYGITRDIIDGLIARGHNTTRYRGGTVVNALKIDQRRIHAISDFRKDACGVAGF